MSRNLERSRPAPVRRSRGRPAANAPGVIEEEQLLAAAFALFAQRGYDGATVRDLSRQLGISHNLLNVRFGKKDDLWKAAVAWRFSGAARPVEPVFDHRALPEQRLRELVEAFCDWTLTNGDIVAISQQEAHIDSWRIDFIYDRFIGPFQSRLDALLEEVRAVRPIAAISGGALLVMLVHGVGMYFSARELHERIAGTSLFDNATLQEKSRHFAQFVLNGLLPHQP
jgi:AcrR family transcriptional regulator